MSKDCGLQLTRVQVDGGMTANNLLMQSQADLVGIPVSKCCYGLEEHGLIIVCIEPLTVVLATLKNCFWYIAIMWH